MTREEWLTEAIWLLDEKVFDNQLDSKNHKFQINCGICPGKKLSTTIQPYDGEDVKLEDFFPTTISIDHTIKDPIIMLGNLARECVFAFFNESKLNKRCKKLFERYGFGKPYTEFNMSDELECILKEVYNILKEELGEFPGVPVVVYPKEKKDKKKSSYSVFCDACGYELKVSRKMLEKYHGDTPTCMCGHKMGIDYEEESEGEDINS
jgi:hypothetical protein